MARPPTTAEKGKGQVEIPTPHESDEETDADEERAAPVRYHASRNSSIYYDPQPAIDSGDPEMIHDEETEDFSVK